MFARTFPLEKALARKFTSLAMRARFPTMKFRLITSLAVFTGFATTRALTPAEVAKLPPPANRAVD